MLLLLCTILPLFLYESTANYITAWPIYTRGTLKVKCILPPQLVATPDYPVAAGQAVVLRCTSRPLPQSDTLSWQHLQNQTWKRVGMGRELSLTKPQQSGLYRCYDPTCYQYSHNHTVYIISMKETVGENLGIAAFAISLLTLIIIITIVFLLVYQKLGSMSTSSSAAKGVPHSDTAPRGGLPQNDQDMYMNYTNDNQAYTDLDPTSMTGNNVYSVCYEK